MSSHNRRFLSVIVIVLELIILSETTFFGNIGGCDCGIPPCSCSPALPICPPPAPCPSLVCPSCDVRPPPPACPPPPPVPLCSVPQPIYPPQTGPAHHAPPLYNTGPVVHGASPPSALPHYLLEGRRDLQNASSISPLLNPTVTQQLSPLASTTRTITDKRAHGAVTISEIKCNSSPLRELLIAHMDEADPVISKRAIHQAAQADVNGDDIDIICSDSGFTYIVSTSEYCEAQKEKVICFIYKKT
uniref:Ground-like domain-containing protein n=1 Tax=Setaria digitata TaxID=48799 RepID=A0A915PQT0_9BILA